MLERIFDKLFRSDFAKNSAYLTSGTAIIQGLTVLCAPIITRLYSPDEMGIFTLYASFLSILLIVGTLKYELAIPIAKDNNEVKNVIWLSLISLTSFTLLLFLVSFLFKDHLLKVFNAQQLKPYIYLLSIGLWIAGIYNILLQWALRNQAFKIITNTKIRQGIGLNGGQIGLGLFGLGPFGLIIGYILGKSAGIITIGKRLLQEQQQHFFQIEWNKINKLAKRYKSFVLYGMPAQLLSTGGLELPVIFITAIYSTSEAGQYGIAHLLISIPIALIGNAVGDVFYSEAAKNGRKNPDALLRLSEKLIKQLILIGIIPTILLVFLSPWLFAFVFSSEWKTAGEFAQILAVLGLFRLVLTPVTRVYIVFEKNFALLLINSLRVILVVASFGYAYYVRLDIRWALAIYSVSMILIYLISYIYSRKIIQSLPRTE
ncbi:MAG: oligosaccharide flippase family protein [Crocinitomicaceae bacterium]|nr:oligosaccharide flippase family protein [Crocinitomicaceae bacterium]